ncbi:CdaR family transcriptional regulator [Bacillus massiliglaciei]|uniref:CdaR family transcriptional regulator n=1 Tax=Bacillus massiliglaciei TaxID=1816693 RepID=UPI000DA634D8|nr:sugar diacid recognition domain-containing protein [Bacillus massiliglaciei]
MISSEIAETIVQETSRQLNRNVNIMDNKGYIIATRDKERIHQIHEGALEVLKTGETLSITKEQKGKWQGVQPGINMPIVFQDQIVGVLGVSGEPQEIKDVSGIVKMITELMLKQSFTATQQEWEQRNVELIIGELLKEKPSQEYLQGKLDYLGLNLKPPFQSVLIHITERTLSNQFILQQAESILHKEYAIISFIQYSKLLITIFGMPEEKAQKKITEVYKILKSHSVHFRMASGLPFDSLSNYYYAYKDCELALEIGNSENDYISFDEIEEKALVYQINSYMANRFIERVINKTILQYEETLEQFFLSNLNIQETADNMFIHRNTLIYRLNKIKEKTGFDPRYYQDAKTLQIAIWLNQRKFWEEDRLRQSTIIQKS